MNMRYLYNSSIHVGIRPTMTYFFRLLGCFPSKCFRIYAAIHPIRIYRRHLVAIVGHIRLLLVFFGGVSFIVTRVFGHGTTSFRRNSVHRSTCHFSGRQPFRVPIFPCPRCFRPTVPRRDGPYQRIGIFPCVSVFLCV